LKFTTLIQFVTPQRTRLAAIVCILLAGSVVALAQPWLAGELARVIIGQTEGWMTTVKLILLVWLVLLMVRSLINFAGTWLIGATGEDMGAQLRARAYDHLQILPLAWHQERRAGDSLALLTNDTRVISHFVTNTLASLLPTLTTFVGALAIMAVLDPAIAVLAVVLMPGYYLATKLIGRRIRPVARQWMDTWASKVALVEENVSMLPAIKAFGREGIERQRYAEKNRELRDTGRQQILLGAILGPTLGFLAGAGLMLMLWLGIRHVQSGVLTAGDLVSLLLYAMLLTRPISALADVYGQVQRARGAAERLQVFFSAQPEPLEAGKPDLQAVRGEVEFRDVDFTYPGAKPLLRRFNLKIAAGETIALTGPNGAGKTTLVHLLLRFMDPEGGSVRVDDSDIREVSLSSLRENVGLVAQHTLLLNGTIAENIRYGRHQATEEDIQQAAAAANADAFIAALPDGYDTVIGDQGIKLSGGERQRLSLARTLIKDPPILVLDEATAMFDPEGERGFIEECAEVLAERTVILITHRPASLALADRTYRMVVGKLEEVG